MPKNDKTALICGVQMLSRRDMSSRRLKDKLRQKGYDETEIDSALAKLTAKRYLNDADTCAREFSLLYEESKQSVKQICAKLLARGFDHELIMSQVPNDTFEREIRVAERHLTLKFKPDSPKIKMQQNLYGKGFSYEVIETAVRRFSKEE